MKTLIGSVLVIGCVVLVRPASGQENKEHDCARGKRMQNVSLTWRPTEEIALPDVIAIPPGSAGLATVRIEIKALTDTRQNPQRIGENREDVSNGGCVYPVIAHNDIVVWTTDRFRYLMQRLGLGVVEGEGDVVISGELRQFFVTETHTYAGEIGLKIDVTSTTGKALWSGLVTGSNGHWGKSYKLENYEETLSDALIDAVKNLTADQGFFRAISVKD